MGSGFLGLMLGVVEIILVSYRNVFCFVVDFIISYNIVEKFVIFCKEKNYYS